MRVRLSEFCSNYKTYTFGYAVYAKPDSPSELPELYNSGFLPYSGDLTLGNDIFYMARSVRVSLAEYHARKDERYVLRKFEARDIRMRILPKDAVVDHIPSFWSLCLAFAKDRFRHCDFTSERLEFIVNRPFLTHIAVFQEVDVTKEPLAFALLVLSDRIMHIWYSFHRLRDESAKNFGKYLIVRLLEYGKEANVEYCYLGTCYSCHSRYKTGFHGAEFYDGTNWNRNLELLQHLHDEDDDTVARDADIFKLRYLPIDW